MRKTLFTAASLGGLAGAVSAVTLVCNSVQHATGWFERWFALVVSIAISVGMGVWSMDGTPKEKVKTLAIATLNGFLIYFSAFGVQNSVIGTDEDMETKTVSERVMMVPASSRVVERVIPPPPGPSGPLHPPVPPRIVTEVIEIPPVYETRDRQVLVPAPRTFRSRW